MLTTTRMDYKPVAPRARDDYLSTQVSTATPAQLTMMLFDGADRYLQAAVQLLEPGMTVPTTPVVTEAVARSVAIVHQLLDTLDVAVWPEGEKLQALYVWIADELVQVNVAKRVLASSATPDEREAQAHLARRLERARTMLADVADAFRRAGQELPS